MCKTAVNPISALSFVRATSVRVSETALKRRLRQSLAALRNSGWSSGDGEDELEVEDGGGSPPVSAGCSDSGVWPAPDDRRPILPRTRGNRRKRAPGWSSATHVCRGASAEAGEPEETTCGMTIRT